MNLSVNQKVKVTTGAVKAQMVKGAPDVWTSVWTVKHHANGQAKDVVHLVKKAVKVTVKEGAKTDAKEDVKTGAKGVARAHAKEVVNLHVRDLVKLRRKLIDLRIVQIELMPQTQ